MAHGNHETEIKLPVADPGAARKILRAAGFRLLKRRVFEVNTVFDTPQRTLGNSLRLLRMRHAGSSRILTYKGPPTPSKHKSREELELPIPDPRTMTTIIERLGFQPVFRYEKYRTEYQQPGRRGLATLDETPIGTYVELEGPASWIDRTARQMSFTESDYITESYGALYRDWCARKGIDPANMVFDTRSSRGRKRA